MSILKDKIVQSKLPVHIAIIMDGNGRWAKSKGKPRVFGHKSGVSAVKEVTEASAELGVQYLTLYAFSTENWARPSLEVNALMSLLVETVKNIRRETLQNMNQNQLTPEAREIFLRTFDTHEGAISRAGKKRCKELNQARYNNPDFQHSCFLP